MRALVLAMGIALMVPASAWAKPRVAIAPFDGDPGGELEDVVAEQLDGDYTIAGPSQVRRTSERLGLADDLTEKDLKKLAKELEADAIVRGEVASKSGHKVLHVRLFVNGKRIHGFKVEFASARSDKMKQALKDKLLEKLGGDEAKPDKPDKKKGGDEGEVAEGDDTSKKKDGGDDREDTKKKRGADDEAAADDEDGGSKKKKRVARGGDDDEEIDAEVEVGAKPSYGSPHTANRAAIRVDFGGSASERQLVFNSRQFEQAPKPYKNAPVPGGRVAGELYPVAFGNPDSFAAGLGIGGNFDQTIGLKLRSTAQPGTQFPVKESHWSVGGRFRIAFGRKATSPTATLRGGIFRRQFKVDRTALMEGNIIDLPDVAYKGFDPGLDLRFPIIPQLAFVLGGEAYFITDAGSIQTPAQYGQARVTGGEGYAGLDIIIARRFALRLQGEVAIIGFKFTGNGQMANNRDGVPKTPDVGGALDRFLGGSVTFGVIY